ncbi:reverse transcriptase domain-containing protein [Tanacetum coccineum]
MAANGNGDDGPPSAGAGLPVPDLRTMEELCQPSLKGRGGLIAPIAIQATNFGLKNDMIQQVQNSCPFREPGDDANKHLDKFLHVTQSMKVNGVSDDALRLYLFPYSLQHRSAEWFDRLPRNSITTFDQMAKIFLGKYFPPSMVTKLRNDIMNFRQEPDESLFEAWERYKLSIDRCPNHNMLPVTHIDTFYNGLTLRHRDTINVVAGGTFMKRRPEECYDLIENMTAHHKDWDTSAQWNESSSSTTSSNPEIAALKLKMAEINKNLMKMLQTNQQVNSVTPSCETCGGPYSYNNYPATVGQTQNVYAAGAYNQGGNSYQPQGVSRVQNPPPAYQAPAYQAPPYQAPVHQAPIPQLQVEKTNEFKTYMDANDAILKNIQTNITTLTNSNLELKNIFGQFMKMNTASSSGSRTLPSNTVTKARKDLKVVERETKVTKDTVPPTNNRSTEDVQPPVVQVENHVPIFEPVVDPVSALMPTSKPSIPEMARTPLNEHCLAVILNKLPEKLGDPGKFLIPYDFPRMDECLALANLSARINLMPLSVCKKLSLSELTPTSMTLELADCSISQPIGIIEDVYVKVGKFQFLADFVVIDFDADSRVPLILGRSFLKMGRSLIDVYEGELTLRVGKEAVTFNLDQTSRYSANYNDMTVNRVNVIDMACEEYSQEVLSFSDVIASGNPTPYYDPIVSTSSPTLTPFGDSDNLLEEVNAFLALEDDPTSPEVELKDLPPHLEYAFLEGDDKLPVIIAKDLSVEEKDALIKVLKSHKQAIAWKLSDIKGINPEFCIHKILMEEDYKPTVQHQRWVNPKIHDVIKKEVEKLLDA